MDRLWTPWRYQYITGESGEKREASDPNCIFCTLQQDQSKDKQHFILHRAKFNYVVLNIYPYTSGHLLIVPYQHTAELDAATRDTTDELMELAKKSQTALRATYNAQGFNLGMNLGRAAGAGVAGHIHLHVMPRWAGDANFMTTVGETRVLPEDLSTTYSRLLGKF
ncbi:MAG: HIT domain-containing protein [Acidobacteriota bacterium]|nr:HIT domain-containing protein [Acidobacteriota bacterium]